MTERLSHDGANVPVIILTVEPDHPLATRAVEGGVIMVLAKPFPGERLIEVIQTVIRAQRELFKLEHLSGVMLFLGSRQSSSS